VGIEVRTAFDEGGAGDQVEQVFIVAYALQVNAVQVDVFDGPVFFLGDSGSSAIPLKGDGLA
jgi:hypothetical protein